MAINFSIRCASLNHKNFVPVDISVHKVPAVTEMVKVKEEDKAVVEEENTIREAGYEIRFTKAGSTLSTFQTKAQIKELRDYLTSILK